MNKNLPIIPLILSVLLGFASFALILNYLNGIKQKDRAVLMKEMEVQKIPKFKIVVASKNIGEFEKLGKANLKTIELAGKEAPKNTFKTVAELEGKFASFDIAAENIIQKSIVGDKPKPKTIHDVIPEGMRAISLQVADTVMDFVSPGTRVDILGDFTSTDGTKYSKIILQNVLVLAKGNQIEAKKETSEPGSNARSGTGSTLITFALTIKQAEALSILDSQSKQKLRVALRSKRDSQRVYTEGTSADYLIGEREEIKKEVFVY